MTYISRKFFIASLIYLLLGLLAQAIAAVDAWLGFNPLPYTALTATQQLFLLGWLTQLAMALVYERWEIGDGSPRNEAKRGQAAALTDSNSPDSAPQILGRPMRFLKPHRSLSVFVLFNAGLILLIIGQPGVALFGGAWLGVAAVLGGLLQLSAGALFVYQAWPALRN